MKMDIGNQLIISVRTHLRVFRFAALATTMTRQQCLGSYELIIDKTFLSEKAIAGSRLICRRPI